MQTITEKIIDAGFNDRIFTETDLARLFAGTRAKRYGLVNKALKKGELIRIRRGLYVVAAKYRKHKFSKFVLANHIVPYSYVSLESALSYHGWIPEKVTTVLSIISMGPSRVLTNDFCDFEYYRIPTEPFEFLTGVTRESPDHQSFLIATPIRALADYVYVRKLDYVDLNYLQNNLRIELDVIGSVLFEDIEQLKQVFNSQRVIKFLDNFKKIVKNL